NPAVQRAPDLILGYPLARPALAQSRVETLRQGLEEPRRPGQGPRQGDPRRHPRVNRRRTLTPPQLSSKWLELRQNSSLLEDLMGAQPLPPRFSENRLSLKGLRPDRQGSKLDADSHGAAA